MASASISGLVSGLDTATIINQLMQLEAIPQSNLKDRVSTQERQISSLQTINSKLANIATKAGELAKGDAWSPTIGTSSNEMVTVTASGEAVASTIDITVNRLATASVIDYGTHALTDLVNSDGSTFVTLTKTDGTTIDLDTGDGTIEGLVNVVNAGNYGVKANLVQVAPDTYRLRLTASDTGQKTFSLAAQNGSPMAVAGTLTQGVQAKITIGTDTILSDSNTYTDLMPGVNVTLGGGLKAGDTASITVARDVEGMAASVKTMVEAVNAALDEIDSLTAYGLDGNAGGILAGDPTLRGVRNQFLSAVTTGVGDKSLATYGIQTDKHGKLVFDEAKFTEVYRADPVVTSKIFTDPEIGFAAQVAKIAEAASDPDTGTVTATIKGRNDLIENMEDKILDWDVRLENKRLALERQYTALEVALSKLQNQSQWLSGAIAGLPNMLGE